MKKAQIIKHWTSLRADQPVKPTPVPYKHRGSTFDQDGIRVTGTLEFIDSVLSRLQDLLECENGETRLQVSMAQSVDKDTGATLNSWNCYVQCHQRGGQARMLNAVFFPETK